MADAYVNHAYWMLGSFTAACSARGHRVMIQDPFDIQYAFYYIPQYPCHYAACSRLVRGSLVWHGAKCSKKDGKTRWSQMFSIVVSNNSA